MLCPVSLACPGTRLTWHIRGDCSSSVFYSASMGHIPPHKENLQISGVSLEFYIFFLITEKPFYCRSSICCLSPNIA
uniref:Uncharacterized protein n=1 Tax=Dromaius novaehollandiae TaxID=8790 RepID=A0A8C4JFU7_DRONO